MRDVEAVGRSMYRRIQSKARASASNHWLPQVERRANERIGCWNHNSRRRGSVYKFRDKSKVEYDSPTSPISSEAHSRIPRSPRNAATSNFALCQELARLVGAISDGVGTAREIQVCP